MKKAHVIVKKKIFRDHSRKTQTKTQDKIIQ